MICDHTKSCWKMPALASISLTHNYEQRAEDIRLALLPEGSCKGSLRALKHEDTVKIGPLDYITICYNCEKEVAVDTLLTTISGVLTPIPRIAIHMAPDDET